MPTQFSDDRQRDIVDLWERIRMHAMSAKRKYRDTARTARRYYDGPHDFVFEEANIGKPPTFKVTVNKVYEMLRLFGPMCYAQNPTRNVENKVTGSPQMADALGLYLNYTPGEFGLKDQSKRSIDESILNGRGVMYTGPDARTGHIRSVSLNSKDILIDPDQSTWYAGDYVMRLQRNVPLWKVSRTYGKAAAQRISDRGAKSSIVNSSFDWGGPLDADAGEMMDEQKQESNREYELDAPKVSLVHVFSKMGMGMRAKKSDKMEYITGKGEDNLHIVYEPCSKTLLYMYGWPIPYWADVDKQSWPFSFLDPAENADAIWPISLIKPALGEQMFLDWGWSFALGFIQAASRAILISGTPMDSNLEMAIKSNAGIEIVRMDVPAGVDPKGLLQALQMPQLNPALLSILQEVEILFEKRTGMNEILYGTSQRAMRSATEAEMKGQFSRMRIDDIIDKVEDWASIIARKEAVGARWLLGGQEMLPIMGQELAQLWEMDRMQNQDITSVMREYSYNVTAGSTRKRTPQAKIDTATMMYDRMAPLRLQVGDLPGYNMIEQQMLKAHSIPNPDSYMLATPPVPEQGQQGQQDQGPPPPPQAPEVVKIENGEPVYATPTGE